MSEGGFPPGLALSLVPGSLCRSDLLLALVLLTVLEYRRHLTMVNIRSDLFEVEHVETERTTEDEKFKVKMVNKLR